MVPEIEDSYSIEPSGSQSNHEIVSLSDSSEDDESSLTVASASNHESGSVVVSNCSDIHVGNRTIFQCPVTIRQVVYATRGQQNIAVDDFIPGLETATVVQTEVEEVTSRSSSQTQVDLQEHNGFIETTEGLISKEEPSYSCRLRRRHIVLIMAACAAAAILTVATLLILLPAASNEEPIITTSTAPPNVTEHPITSSTKSGSLHYVDRAEWGGKPASSFTPQTLPVAYVIISHTAGNNCSSHDACATLVRNIQRDHMTRLAWNDIGYNFLVGGDGYVYVGRGWDRLGSHSRNFNSCSVGISFIGTFITVHPPKIQMDAAQMLMAEGVSLGKIKTDYRLLGHRQVSASDSPGEALFTDLKKLTHFSYQVLPCNLANAR